MINLDLEVRCKKIMTPEEIADNWQELEKVSQSSIFLSWHWIGNWLRIRQECLNLVLVSVYKNNKIIALSIFSERQVIRNKLIKSNIWSLHEYQMPNMNMVIQYNGILAEKGYEKIAQEKILRFLTDERKEWDELIISGVDIESPIINNKLINKLGLMSEITAISECNYIDLDKLRNQGKDYLLTLSRNTRYQINRSIRKYNDYGEIKISIAASLNEALVYFNELKTLHQIHWKKKGHKGSFSNENWEKFHKNIIRASIDTGKIQLVRISAGKKVIGYLYNLIMNRHVFAIQSGFNYENNSNLHPGYVSHYMAIKYNLEHGNYIYNFLAGKARYKKSLANESNQLVWIKLQRKKSRLLVERIVKIILNKLNIRKTNIEV